MLKHLKYLILFLFFFPVLFFLLSIPWKNDDKKIQRRLNYYIPPIKGEYTDYSEVVKATSETSHRAILKSISSIFQSLSLPLNLENIKEPELSSTLHSFEEIVWNATTNQIVNSSSIQNLLSDVVNGMFNSNEKLTWQKIVHEGRRLEDLIDLVIVVNENISPKLWLEFLESWRPLIEKMSLIIIQQGDPNYHFEIPPWVEYVLFNSFDVKHTLGEFEWLIEMNSTISISSAKSFGLMVADRDFVFFLDPLTRPMTDPKSGFLINPFEEHLLSLLTPSTPYYYNFFNDPFQKGSDFFRGYPHTLKEGIPTAISIGATSLPLPYDAVIRMAKQASSQPPPDTFDESPSLSIPSSSSPSQTIPYGTFFSLSTLNTVVYRKMAGPCLYFPHPRSFPGYSIGNQNAELLMGWVCKVVLDHVRGGVKAGGRPTLTASDQNALTLTHISDVVSSSSPPPLHPLFEEFKGDLVWTSCSEHLLRALADLTGTLSLKSQVTTQDALRELAVKLKDHLSPSLPSLSQTLLTFSKALTDYAEAWNRLHAFKPTLLPVASRSSWRTRSLLKKNLLEKEKVKEGGDFDHNCAAFTIVHHNREPEMLPVWERYYNRHFPGSTFILHHHVNTTYPDPSPSLSQRPTNSHHHPHPHLHAHHPHHQNQQQQQQQQQKQNQLRGSDLQTPPEQEIMQNTKGEGKEEEEEEKWEGSDSVHWDLYGDPHGFPVHFLSFIATLTQSRFFRAGYSCVLYSDVDEIIAPDPKLYPQGLKQYIHHFVSDPSMANQLIIRAVGVTLGHVSESIDSSPPLEPKIHWNQSILSQRSYKIKTSRYDKPLLSKMILKWKPGFHTAFYPPVIDQDPNLYLIHLHQVDKEFCLQRELRKGDVFSTLGHRYEIEKAFNGHLIGTQNQLASGELCRYGRAAWNPVTDIVVDFKGSVTLEKLDDAWKNVEV